MVNYKEELKARILEERAAIELIKTPIGCELSGKDVIIFAISFGTELKLLISETHLSNSDLYGPNSKYGV